MYWGVMEEAFLAAQREMDAPRERWTRLAGVPVLVDGAGAILTVRSTEPMDFLRLHRKFPSGRRESPHTT